MILAPLLVMVLLTMLVGATAYQQAQSWESNTSRTLNQVSRLIILNNIRWGLRKTEQERFTNPVMANNTWKEIQHEILMLKSLPDQESSQAGMQNDPLTLYPILSHQLEMILASPQSNSLLIKAFLENDVFSFGLEQVNQLKQVQAGAQMVTFSVTASMIFLGLLLTGMTAYDLDKMFQQLGQSRDLNIRLQEEERRRIAQDLHDGVIQDLIGLKRQYNPAQVDQILDQLRRVCHNLKPQLLEDLGLSAALEFLADDLCQAGIANVQINVDEIDLSRLPNAYELPLFRVIQELCSNIKRHAQASQAKISLIYNPEESTYLNGYVSDNGRGFLPSSATSSDSMGLKGVKERIEQLGGQLIIKSVPGQGSLFQFKIPVKS